MRIPVVAGNWKMNPPTIAEAIALASTIGATSSPDGKILRIICPPFPALIPVQNAVAGTGIEIGAQNMHRESGGAFTGEVSGAMLIGLCSYVIVGHSERRQLFGEIDESVNAKLKMAIELGLRPILCVGETLVERDAGRAEPVVAAQLAHALDGIDPADLGLSSVAYEPVWAIGTGRAATPDIAQEMASLIRREVANLSNVSAAEQISILYGGSVNPSNASEIAGQHDVDGALVGGASLNGADFASIIDAFSL